MTAQPPIPKPLAVSLTELTDEQVKRLEKSGFWQAYRKSGEIVAVLAEEKAEEKAEQPKRTKEKATTKAKTYEVD